MLKGLAYLSLALGGASPAAALTPAWIWCEASDGQIADYIYTNADDDEMLPGMTTFQKRPQDRSAHSVTNVILHCGTGQAVIYQHDMDDDGYEILNAAIEGEDPVTLRQLAKRLKAGGFYALYDKLPTTHCACRPETHRTSY